MEWLSQLFGFLIVLFVFLVPLIRKQIALKKKVESKQQEPEEEKEEEETSKPPPFAVKPRPIYQTSHQRVDKKYEFHDSLEKRYKKTVSKKNEIKTPLDFALKGKNSLKTMVILSEIIGPPKGLQ